jgi:DNA-binding CsgD family transcriptional regulator
MMKIEFFINGRGRNLIINDLNTRKFKIFEESDKELIDFILKKIEVDYPEAHNRLKELYGKSKDHHYLMVSRFLRCNFAKNDHKPDIDEDGNFDFENIQCPLRGFFCKEEGVICNPKLSTSLSEREKEIAIRYANGYNVEEIGEKLFISPNTVKNHRAKIYAKLSIHSRSELVNWCYKNRLL